MSFNPLDTGVLVTDAFVSYSTVSNEEIFIQESASELLENPK